MIVRATASITTEYSAVPDNFLEVKSFKLDTNPVTPLGFETIDSMDTLAVVYTTSTLLARELVKGGLTKLNEGAS